MKIYAYDNRSGIDIPAKVDIYPIELLLGDKISDVISSIESNATLFIVFTHMNDCDFGVYSDTDKELLEELLSFGKYDYSVSVKSKGAWYTDKAEKCIIVSDSVKIESEALAHLLKLFISNSGVIKKETQEIYIVKNERNGNILMKTPDIDEAEKKCDEEPCSVVIQRSTRAIIYRTKYGKVAVPLTKEEVVNKPNINYAKTRFVLSKIK